MKFIIYFILLQFVQTYVYSNTSPHIDETDYYELVDGLMPLDSFEIISQKDTCISEYELNEIVQNRAREIGGNLIYYSKYKGESRFDRCTYAKVYVFNVDSTSKINNHSNLVEIVNRQKYSLKISVGYTTGSYYFIVGGEYIFPFVHLITAFYMPSLYLINKNVNELYVQLTGPTIFGMVDSYYLKNIYGNKKDNRFGIKLDGGFFITEALAHIFPYEWFKYGTSLNYHTTLQPYISYTYASENYNREIMVGVVLTKWLNPNGLIICCK